jgi:uroporphyrinogen decarboxylase
MSRLTSKERFIKTLKRERIGGRVPTFELVFFLTMEALGKVHPTQRHYGQWNQMSENEKKALINDTADVFILTAQKYHHDAIFVHANPGDFENQIRLFEAIRERSGDEYFLMLHGDPTFSMPGGNNMIEFTTRLYEDADGVKRDAQTNLDNCRRNAEMLDKRGHLIDGFALCADYCFNVNPFFTP